MDKRPLVYIAGPYTRPDPVQNTRAAMDMAEKLLAAGYTPIIPHLCLAWDMVYPKPGTFWYEYDLAILKRCDFLLRIPGASTGADREVDYAFDNGIGVCYTIGELDNLRSIMRER
jgi:nucleoside 2-deoxyribosyltransferase